MSPTVKCLVWDLDDTLWGGVVLEGDAPTPFPAAVRTLHALDDRGILHVVASRGHHDTAVAHLDAVGLTHLFCAVEVGWGDKSAAVRRIAATLGIGVDTLAFVDNDPVERAEVARALPPVRCYDATQVGDLAGRAEFQPPFVTDESRQRRQMYQAEHRRAAAEKEWGQPDTDFLASLDLVLTVRRATEDDLARAHELTVRTHQLNSTGITYGMAELRALCHDPDYQVTVAELTDRFGRYGTIGLAVTRLTGTESVLELLLMSCRVVSRGVGAVLLDHLVRTAVAAGRRPVAELVPTPVNRIMLVTLRFGGFEIVRRDADRMLLAADPARLPPARPGHVRVDDRTGVLR
ncbi:HAD-IIIC family phosphatase [Micromonospora endolithica]|uniref:HAD-IIIC family phosphatase n=1 Tax=Micromonospora endolithica TaxID=230091 RepID=A0A3A9Z9Z7_9ACTN|nr:HAD-IIIC family phosphatase [Micromonospora endolithica]RKN45342.1 HAD-IIIC family phosphatase [Micromonospora endolithica]TWJ22960.1 HAD superfamily phosphatase (TIGR01681 family)/FkbH-like protein [Micromonospora endolithica]